MKLYLQVEDLLLFNAIQCHEKLKSFMNIPIERKERRPSLVLNSKYNRSVSLSDVGSVQFVLVSELISGAFLLGVDVEPRTRAIEHSLKNEIERHPLYLQFSLQFSILIPSDVDLHLLFWVWIEALYKSNASIDGLLSSRTLNSVMRNNFNFLVHFDTSASSFYFDNDWLIAMVKNHEL